ncbi:MAG: hypothetical protein R3C27_12245 [Hyphomonadaceae bacterium]
MPVSTVDEVLKRALTRPLTPIEWSADELAETGAAKLAAAMARARDH